MTMSGFVEYIEPRQRYQYAMALQHIGRYIFASSYVDDKSVLDVACGAGYGSNHLASVGAKIVAGLDRSLSAISYANAQYEGGNLSFVRGDAHKLPYLPRSFDVCVSFETLEHLTEPGKFLAECCRILTES